MAAEGLRSGDVGFIVEKCRLGMIKGREQAWGWKCHSHKQLTRDMLKKCRSAFRGNREQRNSIYKFWKSSQVDSRVKKK